MAVKGLSRVTLVPSASVARMKPSGFMTGPLSSEARF